MNQDTKIGLALALLLLGTIGAFFFRNESGPSEPSLGIVDFDQIDQQIAEKGVFPYLGQDSDSAPTSSQVQVGRGASDTTKSPDALGFPTPDFLREPAGQGKNPLPEPPPNPIPTGGNHARTGAPERKPAAAGPARPTSSVLLGTPAPSPEIPSHANLSTTAPKHNNAWQVVEEKAPPTAKSVGPQTHRVRKGETLSALAKRYLGDSNRFLEIFEANRDLLRNPNDLQAGMEIRIPTDASKDARKRHRADSTSSQRTAPTAPKGGKQANHRFVPMPWTPLNPR